MPTIAAVRAAKLILQSLDQYADEFPSVQPFDDFLAASIDRETGLPELFEALQEITEAPEDQRAYIPLTKAYRALAIFRGDLKREDAGHG